MFKIKYNEKTSKLPLKLGKQENNSIKKQKDEYFKNRIIKKQSQIQIQSIDYNSLDTRISLQSYNNRKNKNNENKQNEKNEKIFGKIDENNKRQQSRILRSKTQLKLIPFPKKNQMVSTDFINSKLKVNISNFLKQFQNQLNKCSSFQEKTTFFPMNKAKFFQIITLFSYYLVAQDHLIKIQNQTLNIQLKNLSQKLSVLIFQERVNQKRQRLKLKSYVYGKQYTEQDFYKDITLKNIKIGDLNDKLSLLTFNVDKSQLKLNELQELLIERNKLFVKDTQNYTILCQQLQRKSAQLQNILNQIKYKQNILRTVEEQTETIFRFVQFQKQKPIFRWACGSCKKYEKQLYQYSIEMKDILRNKNVVSSGQQFKQIQKQILSNLDNFNEELEWVQMSSEEIVAKINTFINTSIDKFKVKNDEISKDTDKKVQCLTHFMELIEKWMENYDLKQHYLKGLRNQFVSSLQTIEKVLIDMQIKEENQFKSQHLKHFIETLKKNWTKIHLNYKYTNTFF